MSYYSTCPDCGAHLDPGEQCDCRTYEIAGKRYPITGRIKHSGREIPIVGLKMMSDYKWQKMCLEDRLKNPDTYREHLGEDVDAVIAKLKTWLEEHKEEAAQI